MILWKYLNSLQKNNKEQGFTIPLILGFGLFMLAISLTSIKTSSTSEVDSKVQQKSKQAIGAAELGLARIQEIIDTNRTIAVYNDCITRDGNGTCTDAGNVASWANATAIRPGSGAASCSNAQLIPTLTDVEELTTTQWQDASTDPGSGQYRLLSYTYASESNDALTNPNALPGIATLILEGRTNQFGAPGATIDDEVINTGTARLSFEIPIEANNGDFQNALPGLWMRFDTDANMGTQKVDGNIFIEDQTCNGAGAPPTNVTQANNIDNSTNPDWDVLSTPQVMPDTPDLPPNNRLNKIQSKDLFDAATVLPRDNDISFDGTNSFHYLVSSLDNVANPGSIKITTGANVTLYVQGEIRLAGTVHQSASVAVPPAVPTLTTGSPANLQIYGNVNVDIGAGYEGTDWKYGCGDVIAADGANLGQADCPTQVINFDGATQVNAFLHAPEAWGCLTNGGGGSLTGAMWIRQWTSLTALAPSSIQADLGTCVTTNDTVVTLDATAIPSSLLTFASTNFTEPRVAPLTAWERISR